MPTFATNSGFVRAYNNLPPEQANRFDEAIAEFVQDLREIERDPRRWFRARLRVKRVRGLSDVYEMTWARNGRATFSWGDEQKEGMRHVVWHQIGGHEILP